MDSEQESAPKHAKAPVKSETFSTDVFDFDDRLLALEKQSGQYRGHIVQIQDVLADQMMIISVLEVALAIFIAMALWEQFKGATHA